MKQGDREVLGAIGLLVLGLILSVLVATEFFGIGADAWVAIFTLTLTVSTIGLWVVTRQAANAARDQTKLAREEFIASHRPRVVVRFIQGPAYEPDKHPIIFVTVANVGETPADIEAFGGDLARMGLRGWEPPGLSANAVPIAPIRLVSGQRHVFEVRARPSEYGDDFEQALGDQVFYAVGEIRYSRWQWASARNGVPPSLR